MNVKDAIENRRSIRKYIDKEVPYEYLLELIYSAQLAPSAKNRQPWRFKIITSEEKNSIINMMISYDKNEKEKSSDSISFTDNVMKESSSIILIFRKEDKNWRDFDLLSIGACIENMCLYAEELGLATLWIGDIVFIKDKINDFLKIKDLELVSALAIGYPNQTPKKRPREKLESIII